MQVGGWGLWPMVVSIGVGLLCRYVFMVIVVCMCIVVVVPDNDMDETNPTNPFEQANTNDTNENTNDMNDNTMHTQNPS